MQPVRVKIKNNRKLFLTVLLVFTSICVAGCSDSKEIIDEPSDPRTEGFIQAHSIDEFSSTPTGTINGTNAPLISASAWHGDQEILKSPNEIDWKSLPLIQESMPLIIDSPFPPNEVWITRLETAVDQSLSQENSMAEPVLCSQDSQEVCRLDIEDTTATQLIPFKNISNHGKYRFMTIQAIWFTPSGDESISWSTQIEK